MRISPGYTRQGWRFESIRPLSMRSRARLHRRINVANFEAEGPGTRTRDQTASYSFFLLSLSFFFFTKFFAFYVQNYENNASCCYYRGYCYGRTWLWTNSYVLTPIVNVRPRSLSNEFVARSLMPSCQRDTSTVLCFVFFFLSFNEIRYAFRSRCCFNTLPSRTLKAYRLKWTTRFIDFSRPHR